MADRRFATVIFDLDGTLVDTAADIARAVNVVLAEHDRPAQQPAFVEGFTGRGPTGLIAGIYRAIGLQVDDERLARDVQTYLDGARAEPVRDARLFADAAETLPTLTDRGVAVGVCTNKTTDMAHRVLSHLGVDAFIGAVVGTDSASRPKPDPAHLLETVDRLGGDPETTLYVGDSAIDLQTGDSADITTWLVGWSRVDDPHHRRITTFSEIVDAIHLKPHQQGVSR